MTLDIILKLKKKGYADLTLEGIAKKTKILNIKQRPAFSLDDKLVADSQVNEIEKGFWKKASIR